MDIIGDTTLNGNEIVLKTVAQTNFKRTKSRRV